MNKYKEAYKRIFSEDYHYPDFESAAADLDMLGELVEKETPKPLSFEELKEGMWVWDDKLKEWCVLGSFWKDALNRYYVGGLSDSPWEQNRFYRKQVEE